MSPTAPATAPNSSLTALQPSLRARLDTATMALLQTRDQVMKSLDKHLQELHALRRAMGEGDTSLMATLPPAVATPLRSQAPAFHEHAPMIHPAPQPAANLPDRTLPRESAPAIGLEKATLEELNAALAFAFAHVSNAHQVPQPPNSRL